MPAPIASFPSCSAGRPDAKPSLATSSISTRACSNAPPPNQELDGGSLTALPIIESEAQDISA